MALNFTTDARAQFKNDDLKRRLLECVNNEKSNFLNLAEDFYGQQQRSEESYLQFCKAVIATIDNVLTAGDWEDSLFLRNTVKPLKKIREEALELLQQISGDTSNVKNSEIPTLSEDTVALYISIFQNNGHNLPQWELQLQSITSHLLGRPVYQNEEDMQKAIRLKLAQTSEAYIVVAVKRSAIQSELYQPQRLDRNGNPLVTLTDSAVSPENILEFVHQGKRYHFLKGRLFKQSE